MLACPRCKGREKPYCYYDENGNLLIDYDLNIMTCLDCLDTRKMTFYEIIKWNMIKNLYQRSTLTSSKGNIHD